jgi:TolA-binding protein
LRRPAPGPEFQSLQVLPPLRRDLGLSQEQSEKIKPLIDGYMKKLQDIRENARTEIENTLRQMNEEISSILTQPQRQRWQMEMNQLQQELRPGGPRRNGMGPMGPRGRRGMESGGQRGGRGQRYRRGFQPPLTGPNLPRNDVNENQVRIEEFDPNRGY